MDLIKLKCYAVGYYSEQEYQEDIIITEELYNKISQDIRNLHIYIPELDGKHSEVRAIIETERISTKSIESIWYEEGKEDGDVFYYKLEEICQNINVELYEEIEKVKKYLDSFDKFTTISIRVRESQVHKIRELADQLNEYK